MGFGSLFLFGLLVVSSHSFASVELGPVDLGGSGCTTADASGIMVDDFVGITIEPDDYIVVGRAPRATCLVSIPFRLDPNVRLKLTTVETRARAAGNVGQVALQSEFFIAGRKGQNVKYKLPQDGETKKYVKRFSLKTRCGEQGVLRMNSSLLARAAAVETTGSVESIQFQMRVETCR